MYKSDQEMIEGAINGDAVAFGLLIQKHYNTVYNQAFHYLRNFDDAQDAAQDVFVEVFQSLKYLRDPSKFRAWLHGITLNICKMRLRNHKEMLSLDLIGDEFQSYLHHPGISDPAVEYEKMELQDSLTKAIEFLSENNRLVLKLYYMDGMSYKEIASFLSVPKSTVKGRMHRAMNQLRDEMMDMAKGAFSYKRRRASGSVSASCIIADPRTGAKYTRIRSVTGKNDIVFTDRYPYEIDLSPDGRFMLSKGLVVPLDGSECFSLVDTPTVCCKYSPDGKKVVFFSGGAIWMVHVSPETKPLCDPIQIFGAEYKSIYPVISWAPDSEKIAFPRTAEHDLNRIWTFSIEDNTLAKIADYPLRGFHNPSWSPDGRYIAYYSGNYEEGRALRISPAEGGDSEKVLDIERDNIKIPFWSPDSKWLFHYMLDWKLKAVRISDRHEVDLDIPDEVGYLLSQSGSKMIFFNQSYDYKATLRLVTASGGESCELAKHLTLLSEDRFWSSDSTTIISQGEGNGNGTVFWMIPISGTKPFHLKLSGALPDKAVPCSISPDCQKVLYSVKPDKNKEDLWIAHGDGQPLQVFKGYDTMYRWKGMYQWSPDSTKVAVYKDGIYIASIDGSGPIQVTEGDPRRGQRTIYKWSPDGTMIAFIPYTQGMFELWIVPAVGGEQRKIMNIWSNFFAWSPDSKEIALFDYDGRFVIVSIHNGIARNVFDYEEYGLDDIGYFCWSPDGQYMAFAGYKDEEPPQIYTIALQSGLVKQVTNDKVYDNKRVLSNLYWSPDGKWITYGLDGFVKTRPSVLSGKLKWRSFCMNQRKVKTRFDYSLLFTGLCLASLALSIIVFSLTGVVAQAPQKAQIAFSSDRDGNAEIYIMDADGNNQRRITNDPKGDDWPAWSPDGKIIAFTSDRDGLYEIYAIDADGNNQQNLTNNPADDMSPTWSPDGKLIAFESIRDGNPEIYVMDADGNNQRNLTNNPAIDSAPAWSPDGKVIAFCSMRDGNFEIYVMDANGNNQRRLTNNPAIDYGLAWSPDNQRIAFKSVRDGNQEIYAMDANGNNQRNLTNNPEIDSYPAWSPVGKTIAFASYRDGNQEIYVMDADGNNQRNLTNNPAEDSSPGWFDPDFTYKAISPIDRLMSRWGWIKQGSEY